jgi:hypothetical protein
MVNCVFVLLWNSLSLAFSDLTLNSLCFADMSKRGAFEHNTQVGVGGAEEMAKGIMAIFLNITTV